MQKALSITLNISLLTELQNAHLASLYSVALPSA